MSLITFVDAPQAKRIADKMLRFVMKRFETVAKCTINVGYYTARYEVETFFDVDIILFLPAFLPTTKTVHILKQIEVYFPYVIADMSGITNLGYEIPQVITCYMTEADARKKGGILFTSKNM